MSECLKRDDIERYRRRQFDRLEDLQAVSAHLTDCAACREMLRVAAAIVSERPKTVLSWIADDESACPDEETLIRYVTGEADAIHREIVETHLEECADCRKLLEDLRAFHAEMQRPESMEPVMTDRPAITRRTLRDWLRPSLIAAAAACLLLLVLWSTRRLLRLDTGGGGELQAQLLQQTQQNRALQQQIASAQAHVVQGERRTIELQRLLGLEKERAKKAEQDLQAAKTQMNRTTSKPTVSELTVKTQVQILEQVRRREVQVAMLQPSTAEILRSTAIPVTPIAPVGTFVLEDRPAFSWRSVEEATQYKLTLYDVQNRKTITVTTRGTAWNPPTPLQRGHRYRWQVAAYNGSEQIGASTFAPSFQVLDAAQAREVEEVQRTPIHNPLTLGYLYESMGLLDLAEQQYRTVLRAHPSDPEVLTHLQHLKSLRSIFLQMRDKSSG